MHVDVLACDAGGYLPGASGGGASLADGVPGSFRAVAYIRAAPWQERTEAHQRGGQSRVCIKVTG